MKKRFLTTLGLLALAVTAARADERNLVLHRPYELWPEPSYGECTDPDDGVQLTDGFKNGSSWRQKPTVGWSHPAKGLAVIWFDLGEPATLSELKFYTVGGGAADVVDVGLRVFVSLDNQDFVPAGERPGPGPAEANREISRPITMSVPLKGAKARYVAVAAQAPTPYYYEFVDEIEVLGTIPADPRSILPIQAALSGSGAKGVRYALTGGGREAWLMKSLLAPVGRHAACWPPEAARRQQEDSKEFVERSLREFRDDTAAKASGNYDALRAEATERHRVLARGVYKADAVVWEVIPDDEFGMLSLPDTLKPAAKASIDTVVNALEAAALGAANLTEQSQPLEVTVTGGGRGAPLVTPRIARFFVTGNARYVPDALLATDSPQVIPAGEARLIWLGAESTDARPGSYRYRVRVRVGGQTRNVALRVRVHNVTLSKQTPLSTGNWSDLNTGDGDGLRQVRDDMLAHRITVGACAGVALPSREAAKDGQGNLIRPLQIDFTALDKCLDFHKGFPQFSLFYPMEPSRTDPAYDWFGSAPWMSDEFKAIFKEWLVQVVARITSKGRGYDGFYFQIFDETMDSKVAEICRLVHSADPKVRMMITSSAELSSVRELVDAGMNIFVYHAPLLGYDNAPDGFPLLRSGGRELWFYHAALPSLGSGRDRDPLGGYRLHHWLAFRHGATGVHFWNQLHNSTSGWMDETSTAPFWPQVYLVGADTPPDVKTAETVIPSRRWEYQRMGIEDYMLLKVAQERIDTLGAAGGAYRQTLDGIVKAVLTAPKDRTLFRQQRGALLALLDELM
jgi:hypothetical protein